eukprot:6173835-Pleurochrysis_carterae.AAC.2
MCGSAASSTRSCRCPAAYTPPAGDRSWSDSAMKALGLDDASRLEMARAKKAKEAAAAAAAAERRRAEMPVALARVTKA